MNDFIKKFSFLSLLIASYGLYAAKLDSAVIAPFSGVQKVDAIDYTATPHSKKQVNHAIKLKKLRLINLGNDLDSISLMALNKPMLAAVILSKQPVKECKQLEINKDEEKIGEVKELVTYKKYLLDAQGLLHKQAHPITYEKKYHIVQTQFSHIVVSLMQWLAKSPEPQLEHFVTNLPICAKCRYLLTFLGYTKKIKYDKKGCQSKPFAWPMPKLATQYLNSIILRTGHPFEVTQVILQKIGGNVQPNYHQLKLTLKNKENEIKKKEKRLLKVEKELQRIKHLNQYKGKLLPQDLSGQDLSNFDFTGCQFTYTNLTDCNLANVILANTTCDYQRAFVRNSTDNKIDGDGGYWYQHNLLKDLKSIAKVYSKLRKNADKIQLLHIASGLCLLPLYKGTEFYIKLQYWSCCLLELKIKLGNPYGKQLVCSIGDDLQDDAKDFCWKTEYPQNKISIGDKPPHVNLPQYMKDFQLGLIQYKAKSKNRLGFDYYREQIRHSMLSLQKIHATIKQKELQEEIINITYNLSKSYQFQGLSFLQYYLFCQNCLIKFKYSLGVDVREHIYYNDKDNDFNKIKEVAQKE